MIDAYIAIANAEVCEQELITCSYRYSVLGTLGLNFDNLLHACMTICNAMQID